MKRFFNSGVGIVFILLLVSNFMNGGLSDPVSYFYRILILLPGIIIGLSFHEFAHGFVSYKLGDPTPKNQGRLTLNPKAHFDPFGFLALVFLGFGWGIPVQINPNYYKHKRRDELLVACAGVTMNLILAIVAAFIVRLIFISNPYIMQTTFGDNLIQIMMGIISINLILLVFNLIPIPPLDGFNVITQVFNLRGTKFYNTVYKNGFIILLILLLVGVVDKVISPVFSLLYGLIVSNIIL
ncbi:MAG: site-2 protease family protein [Peptostreptococcaceae bacterium]|nr:site-2 protease family protein [Peptostreptococcaceae bacterium]